MKRAPRSLQHHVLYRKYNGQDSEISALLGKCGVIFPDSDQALDNFGKTLFACSSNFPDHLVKAAKAKGYNLISNKSKFFSYNSDYETVVHFLELGSTPSNMR